MKILAIETSSRRGSIAWLDDETDFFREWDNDRKNSGPFFKNLAGITGQFGPAQRIIVGLGPGSYAGVRIALSTAIGLKAAWTGAELVGYPSICALSSDGNEYVAVGDARRQSFYLARICNRAIKGEIELHAKTEFEAQLMKQDVPIFSSDSLPEFRGVKSRYPSARILAELARSTEQVLSHPVAPIYLREPHITVPSSPAGRSI